MLVGRRYRVYLGAGDNPKRLILISSLRDQCHIRRTGVMVLILQSVWIGKMRVLAAELLGLCIHHVHKIFHGAADMLRHCKRTFICGLQHHGIQALFHGHLLSIIPGNSGTVSLIDGAV